MIEHEKKILISKDEYSYLMNCFGYVDPFKHKPVIKQLNYYFDTDTLSMNQQNITCRIRDKNGKLEGLIKQHSSNTDHSTEIEIEIRNGIFDNTFIDMGLTLKGHLYTERCVIFKNHICEIVLDKNQYLGYTDYELEIEYDSNHKDDALAILKIFIDVLIHYNNISDPQKSHKVNINTQSKSNRFFEKMSLSSFNKNKDTTKNSKSNIKINDFNFLYNIGNINKIDYSYLDNHLDYFLFDYNTDEDMCISCLYFDGTFGTSQYDSCKYEHCQIKKQSN